MLNFFRVQSPGVRPNKQNARENLILAFIESSLGHHHHKIGGCFANPFSRNFGALGLYASKPSQ